MSENVSAQQLRLLIERIETLEEEKNGIAGDIADVYAEAKSTGFDTRTMKAIVKLRKMDPSHRQESDALLDVYRTALGIDDGNGGDDSDREDPRAVALQSEILTVMRTTGRATIVALKAAVKSAAKKNTPAHNLTYDELTIHLGSMISRGEVASAPGRIADFPEYWSI